MTAVEVRACPFNAEDAEVYAEGAEEFLFFVVFVTFCGGLSRPGSTEGNEGNGGTPLALPLLALLPPVEVRACPSNAEDVEVHAEGAEEIRSSKLEIRNKEARWET